MSLACSCAPSVARKVSTAAGSCRAWCGRGTFSRASHFPRYLQVTTRLSLRPSFSSSHRRASCARRQSPFLSSLRNCVSVALSSQLAGPWPLRRGASSASRPPRRSISSQVLTVRGCTPTSAAISGSVCSRAKPLCAACSRCLCQPSRLLSLSRSRTAFASALLSNGFLGLPFIHHSLPNLLVRDYVNRITHPQR